MLNFLGSFIGEDLSLIILVLCNLITGLSEHRPADFWAMLDALLAKFEFRKTKRRVNFQLRNLLRAAHRTSWYTVHPISNKLDCSVAMRATSLYSL